MKKSETEIKILNAIRKSELGLTIEQVAKATDMNRVTASKYLAVMEVKGLVSCRLIGRAKLYSVR